MTLPARHILDSIPDALIVVDPEGRIVIANDRAAQMFGYPTLIGESIDALVPAGARHSHAMRRASFAQKPERRPMGSGRALSGVRFDGSVFPVEVGLGPVEGGLVTCLVRDLTEHSRTEQQIRIQNTALEAAVNAIMITDRQGRIEWINRAFAQMTGYTLEELEGRTPRLFKSGKHPAEFYEALWNRIVAGLPWEGEVVNKRKDGSLYVEDQTIAPVRDKDGEITHFIAIKQDVTERHKAEQAIRAAKETAEATARAKSEFLANTSHELRTPLNAVLGLTELLLRTKLDSEQRNMLTTIEQSGDALLALIDDLLDLSRLEAGRFELDIQAVELRPILEQAIAQVTPRAADKNLAIGLYVDPSVPLAVFVDGRRIHQVILNLLGNATKFTDEGSVSLEVHVLDEDGDKLRLLFEVRDTGPGIRPDQISRLFQSFSQLDASSTRRHGGTGLGLAISQALVQRMDSTIEVESSGVPGRGARFFFELDVEVAPAPSRRMQYRSMAPLPRLHVLVAEDSPVNQQVVTAQLERMGLTCEVVSDGEAALHAIRDRRFDLALMDVNMPILDGLQVVRAVRALTGKPARLPIIAMTASAMRGDRERILASGMDEYVSKPVRIPDLTAAIRRVLGLASAPKRASQPRMVALSELKSDLGGEEAFRSLIAIFIASTREHLDKTETALAAGDANTARVSMHTVRGSAGSCGAPRLSQLSAELEALLTAERIDDARVRFPEVRTAFDEFVAMVSWV